MPYKTTQNIIATTQNKWLPSKNLAIQYPIANALSVTTI